MKQYLTKLVAGIALTTALGCAKQEMIPPTNLPGPRHECFSELTETEKVSYDSQGKVLTRIKMLEGTRTEGDYVLSHETDTNGDGIMNTVLNTDFVCDDLGNLTKGIMMLDGEVVKVWTYEKK